MRLFELSVVEAAERIRRGEVSPLELVEALLGRIDALEPDLQAWETVDREGALAAARRAAETAGSAAAGPLHGVPLGVKDIFHTAGLRTTNGSPLFRDFVPDHDATSVARLRRAGAILLGKTVTVQFAHFDPPPTRNPWNRARTPGGSSSGSAAAVAARMVPAAVGSQTGGSVLRPASYCGVVGFKPTYGLISRHGVTPASWSLDHVGVLARTVADAALLVQAMAGRDPLDPTSLDAPPGNYLGAALRKERPPRLGLVSDSFALSRPEVAAHLREVAERFERAGAGVVEVTLPAPMQELLALRAVINQVEAAALHARLLSEHPEGYLPRIREQVEMGQLIPGFAFVQAQRLRRLLRPRMEGRLRGLDCLLMPSVSSTAPDLSTTGDNSFQAPWSLFGFPALSLPSGLSDERLPLGTQLVALPLQEETLLSAAAWCEAVLDPMPGPVP